MTVLSCSDAVDMTVLWFVDTDDMTVLSCSVDMTVLWFGDTLT